MTARRIVSLVPSLTEAVCALGARDRLVGRTAWCVSPDGLDAVPLVGGTKDASVDAIVALAPDLVLINREENTRGVYEALLRHGIAVHVSFPTTVAEALSLLRELADLVDADAVARDAVRRAEDAAAAMQAMLARTTPVRVFCPIWHDPLMTIRGDTYISDVLSLCGGENVFAGRSRRFPLSADLYGAPELPAAETADRDLRYPRVSLAEVVSAQPEVVLLPDEPHPFSEDEARAFEALDIPAARNGRVLRVDGRALSWYSPRIADALPAVRGWLHPAG